jgi:hypothetical protein
LCNKITRASQWLLHVWDFKRKRKGSLHILAVMSKLGSERILHTSYVDGSRARSCHVTSCYLQHPMYFFRTCCQGKGRWTHRVGMQVSSRYWEITINTCHHPLWAFLILMNIQQFPFYASSTFRAWNLDISEQLTRQHHTLTHTWVSHVSIFVQ